MFLVSSCTQPTDFPMPQPPPVANHMLELRRLKHLCMHLPPTCQLVRMSPTVLGRTAARWHLFSANQLLQAGMAKQKPDALRYWPVRGERSLHDDLLLRGHHIVIPQSVQQETLKEIHCGRQRIQQCHLRMLTPVWWPGISQQVEQVIKSCSKYAKASVLMYS